MRITIDIQSGFNEKSYENLKKMMDAYVDEFIKADPFTHYPDNIQRINFTISFSDPSREEYTQC